MQREFIELITAVKKFYGTVIAIHSNYYWKQARLAMPISYTQRQSS